jgi:hypothetical protein
MAAHVLNVRKVSCRGHGILEILQGDPAGHEKALDPGALLDRLDSVTNHAIGGAEIADIDELAG